ncbi:MAG: GHKL domain-containing protein [Lachnospiraceae bacterium]|nr:GHKL domain-containing protein [Lachnospiraceae bacterium]
MDFLQILKLINYALVLIYGLFLSVMIAGCWKEQRQRRFVILSCPFLLLIQGIGCLVAGVDAVRQLYPLIVHLPVVLILIFLCKKKCSTAIISVCTAYLCCQLPRWISILFETLTGSALIGELSYSIFIVPVFALLCHGFINSASEALLHSSQSSFLFGCLPIAYYLFDYAATVYSNALYDGSQIAKEFLPTAFIIFYLLFLSAYHTRSETQKQAEFQKSMLEAELTQAEAALERLRHTEKQAAIYQHDMRHHLVLLDSYLSRNDVEQAREYIRKVQQDVESIVSKRFCENDTVNLLCSSYFKKAARQQTRMSVKAQLPQKLSLPNTELCSLLSNGLENALHAAAKLEPTQRWVDFYCDIRVNKLLIEIKNPYLGEIQLQDGIPISSQSGHGYGCRSIQSIVEQHHGLYSFEAENGIFTLRIMLSV